MFYNTRKNRPKIFFTGKIAFSSEISVFSNFLGPEEMVL